MPDRSGHAKDAGAAASGEKSSRNAVSAAPTGSIPQTADYADYGMERSVLACILADPDCINTVSTMLGVRLPPQVQGKPGTVTDAVAAGISPVKTAFPPAPNTSLTNELFLIHDATSYDHTASVASAAT